MSRVRFRDVKRRRYGDGKDINKSNIIYGGIGDRVKAGITDSFMLLMPVLYIVFYLVMDGREDFAEHRLMGWTYIIIPFIIIQSLFIYFGDGQTPGYKSYNLKVVDIKSGEKASIVQIIFRNILALISLITVVPLLIVPFRADRRGLHEILTDTASIQI